MPGEENPRGRALREVHLALRPARALLRVAPHELYTTRGYSHRRGVVWVGSSRVPLEGGRSRTSTLNGTNVCSPALPRAPIF